MKAAACGSELSVEKSILGAVSTVRTHRIRVGEGPSIHVKCSLPADLFLPSTGGDQVSKYAAAHFSNNLNAAVRDGTTSLASSLCKAFETTDAQVSEIMSQVRSAHVERLRAIWLNAYSDVRYRKRSSD